MEKEKVFTVPAFEVKLIAVRPYTSKKTGKPGRIADISVPGVGNGILFVPDGVDHITSIELGVFSNRVQLVAK